MSGEQAAFLFQDCIYVAHPADAVYSTACVGPGQLQVSQQQAVQARS